MPVTDGYVLAVDYGSARVGLSLASMVARLPAPYATLSNNDQLLERLKEIIAKESVSTVVLGLPRNLEGRSTAQTGTTLAFARRLEQLGVKVYLQDEALTSQKAEAELQARGVPYRREDIDALAATYILEDYLTAVTKESQ